jgi:hypothetical protein
MEPREDPAALFISQPSRSGYWLAWRPERHADALAVFRAHKIRPRDMQCSDTIRGGQKWSCALTWEAGEKLRIAGIIREPAR